MDKFESGISNLIPDPEPDFGYWGKPEPNPDLGQFRFSLSKSGQVRDGPRGFGPHCHA